MMSDEELQALSADIKENGLKNQITLGDGGILLDGRNRLEACERAGIDLDRVGLGKNKWFAYVFLGDPVPYIVSVNLKRRHLTKEEIADALIAVAQAEWDARDNRKADKARKKLGQAGPVSKGGRGKRSPVKQRALEINNALPKEDQISERTIKRAIAKAEGRKPIPKSLRDQKAAIEEGAWHRSLRRAEQ